MSTLLALILLTAAPSTTDADSLAIKQLVSSFRDAAEKADTAALLKTFWPEAVVFEHGGVDRTAAAFVNDHLGHHLKSSRMKWTEEENMGRSEGAMAYVAQRAVVETTERGTTKRAPNTFTFVFRKKEGEWRIAHLHWSLGKGVAAAAAGPDAGK